jgi:hypothetical protein
LGTTITYSGTSVAYTSRSDVFRTINMVQGAAADFAAQADTAATGSSDLVGLNGDNQMLWLKVIVTNNAAVANLGTPQLQVFASDTYPATASSALTSAVEASPAINITTTASDSKMYYFPITTAKKYLQLQLNGTSSGAAAGTVQIVVAALVTGRDGAQSI